MEAKRRISHSGLLTHDDLQSWRFYGGDAHFKREIPAAIDLRVGPLPKGRPPKAESEQR
jgi:hypothetical protein